MKYRSIAGTFGRLENAELTLPPGFSILYGQNEAGKTTWCALLAAMLYGVSTSEKRRADFLPDKLRFDPWSGRPAFGRLTLEHGGEHIEIYRKSNKNGLLQEFSAVYEGTADPVPFLGAQTAGETLTGVSKEVFVRSAFFSGASLAVSKDDELERRITALAGTGEEEISASAVSAKLGQWANDRQYQKRGRIPALAREIDELSGTLAEIEQENLAALAVKRRLLALQTEEERATALANAAAQREAMWDRAKIDNAQREVEAAQAAVSAVSAEYGLSGQRGDEAALAEAETALSLANGRKMEEHLAKTDHFQASLRLSEWEQQAKATAFEGLSGEYALELAEQEYETARQGLGAKPALWPFIAGGAFVLIAVLLLATDFFPGLSGIVMPAFFGGFGLLGLGFGLYETLRAARRGKNAAALCEKYGAPSPEGILAAAVDYNGQIAERRARTRVREEAARALSAATDRAALAAHRAETALAALDIAFDGEASSALKRLSAGQAALARAEQTKAAALEKLAFLENELAGSANVSVTAGECTAAEAPNLSAAEAEKARQAAVAARFAALAEDARHQGRLSHYPDKAELSALVSQKTVEKAALSAELEAIQLAKTALEEAASTLSRRLTPKLSRRAEEIFRLLTGSRYDGVLFEKNWRASVLPAGSNELRELFFLSGGAYEQLYLSLRLALSEVVFEAPLPPLVLDDPFASFDDDRLEAALALLATLAEHRQILLFTCREREADRAKALGASKILL